MVVPGSTEPSDPYEKNYNRVKELVAALNVQGTTTAEQAQEILFARVRNAEKYRGGWLAEHHTEVGPAELDRYLRERRRHPYADTPRLWLGSRGRSTLEADGVKAM